MRSNSLLILSLLAIPGWASPGLIKRDVCNADNCLRAVRATNASPFPSSATADCSLFLQKTVTPCPTTTTTTIVVTTTDIPFTRTITASVDSSQLSTITNTVTSIFTIDDSLTVTQPSTVEVTNTIFTTLTTTVAIATQKRRDEEEPLPATPIQQDLAKRVTSAGTCAANTNAPTSVPKYASACSGTVRYSSARSCAVGNGKTTTLNPLTVVATSTSTVHYTPTQTVFVTNTNTIPVTIVQTQTIPSTFETTITTVVVPSLYTETTSIVVTTTASVSPPACTGYNFVVTNGDRVGEFVTGGTPSTSQVSYGFVNFTSIATQAMTFTLQSDGRVYGNNVYGWTTTGFSLYYILQMTDSSEATYGTRSVYCTIGNGDSTYAGAVGMLSCTSNGAASTLLYCPQFSNDLVQTPGTVTSGCTKANLAAVPAVC